MGTSASPWSVASSSHADVVWDTGEIMRAGAVGRCRLTLSSPC